MPALPNASYPAQIWDADSQFQDRDKNVYQSNPKAEDYQRIAAELIATQTELDRVAALLEADNRTITGNEILDTTSELILCNISAYTELTLPDATAADKSIKEFKRIDDTGYRLRIVPAGGDTIDGYAWFEIEFQWTNLTMQATESGWYIK